MKKALFPLFFIFIAIGSYAESTTAALFEVNEEEISNQLEELSKLEDYVNAHQGITLSEVIHASGEKNNLNLDVNMLNNFAVTFAEGPPGGIPSFLWGCILGPAGIAIIYFVTEDNAETRKALYGCLALGATYALLYVASYIFAFSLY